jgi:putative phage-type endonuclease
MKIHDLIQGSPEWLAYRAEHFNASDAPAMMGCSPYKTRAALLRELHTGMAPEVDAGTQRRFNDGHRFEALARPLAEQLIGEDLYPVTGSNGRLSASFDGLTLGEDIVFEHKSLNDELRAVMTGEDCGPALPMHYRVQLEQQLLVSGAGRALFMATRWSGDECVESRHCWYDADPELRGVILLGWAQFERDLAAYEPPATVEAAPVGKAPDSLPALRIEVTGAVTASNLSEFKETALTAIRSVRRELRTDADFADAEKAVKWCSDVEQRLAAAKEHALSQTASIDQLFKAIDDISAEARRVRLDLDKLVTRRKTEVKEEAVAKARAALDAHIATLSAEIAPMRLQPVVADFAGAIKGKRSIDSMQDALDTTLAAAKIAADVQARGIRANVATFKAAAEGLEFLFADLGQIVHKAGDDFKTLVQARIAAHKAAEAKREADKKAAEARAESAAAVGVVASPGQYPAPEVQRELIPVQLVRAVTSPDEPATLKLGDINRRLDPLKIDAAGMAELGISPAKTEGAAKLYRESDLGRLLRELVHHIQSLRISAV